MSGSGYVSGHTPSAARRFGLGGGIVHVYCLFYGVLVLLIINGLRAALYRDLYTPRLPGAWGTVK